MDFLNETARLLRGGSGGGGGGFGGGGYSGGSYGGGSRGYGSGGGAFFPYWFYTSRSSVNGGDLEEDQLSTWVYIVLPLFIILSLGLCYYQIKKASRNGGVVVNKDPEFEAAVSEAKRNAAYSTPSSGSSCDVIYETYGGTFDSKYSDRGKTLSAEMKLHLTNDGASGYSVTGEGSDADGTTKVTDGFISYGGNAWWLEETFSGQDAGLKILSKGTFDFTTNTFSGTWRSSSKYQGKYVSFVGKNITKTLAGREDDIPVVQAEADQHTPVAFAMEEPVVSAPQYSYNQGKE